MTSPSELPIRPAEDPRTEVGTKFDVGGVLLDQPFKIRRLGHVGINMDSQEEGLHFYRELLGFRIADVRDDFSNAAMDLPDQFRDGSDLTAYFLRHGADHHSLAMYHHRVREYTDRFDRWREDITVNQISWQVGSVDEVVHGWQWMRDQGQNLSRWGRDMPGSNWHCYLMDPDWFQNEIYYGTEQIGWWRRTKPAEMHDNDWKQQYPDRPVFSEERELLETEAAGIDLGAGRIDIDDFPERYDVQGVVLPRPFKVERVGPVGLFVENLEASVDFYTNALGFDITEEVDFGGHRCVYLRCNTDHHSVALFPIEVRALVGLSDHTRLATLGLRVANYDQLRAAVDFLGEHGVRFREFPAELHPGIDYGVVALDPSNHAILLYHQMEQIGWDGKPRPAELRPKVQPGAWPEYVEGQVDSYLGEPFLGPWG